MTADRRLGRRAITRGGLAMAGLLAAPSLVRAQDFPARTVRVIVPYPAGGGTDLVARLIVSRLAERWKQTVVIDNRSGASGILGSEIVSRAPPDGYTLLVTTSAHAINPSTTKTLPYDTEKDFTAITPLVMGGITLIASRQSGLDTMEKFLREARANPGRIQWGSAENTTRMTGELFRLRAGLQIENVAYKGSAPMIQEMIGGHIPAGVTSPLPVLNHHRNGLLRMLAVTTDKRLSVIPDVPTMAELGIPDMVRPAWFGLFGPGGMSPALTRQIYADCAAVLAEPEMKGKIADLASEPGGEPPDVFAARIKTELKIWDEVAKLAGVQPE